MQQGFWFIRGDSLDWQGDIDEAVAWETIPQSGKAPSLTLSIPRLAPSLLIPIEKGKGRLGEAGEDEEEEEVGGGGGGEQQNRPKAPLTSMGICRSIQW